ncbi:GMC family oxidoreductase [Actinomadura rudentiformis]|uniref:FAD-binding protein n=1 Tax=Actinomadura rudentiformis TaxID=359158 RepID=A0A6H9YSC4_9ACTN|nr:GMC family oxidoreductase N-terminal domain-containing protein [Actinomadura rudentiformis]KAB2346908.1 FAD-binding protein [Actinomadura rudentiformis]
MKRNSSRSSSYDHVVVGAGSAGCVLASRLTEDPRTRVLLVEAGPRDKSLKMRIPLAFAELFDSEYDWAFRTEPQKQLDGRSVRWPRGRTLGGSSSLNGQVYCRDRAIDFRSWEPGWTFDDLLPYFRRSERSSYGTPALHGDAGPLHVTRPRRPHRLTAAFVAAAEQTGLQHVDDLNSEPGTDVVGHSPLNQWRGRRWSSADAYLRPAAKRRNLTVLTDTLCTGIEIHGRQAVSVTLRQGSQTIRVRVDGEVILAAGAISTPHLLQISGIGRPSDLTAAGTTVLHELPAVGHYLQDHPLVFLVRACRRPISLYGAGGVRDLLSWAVLRRGPLASNAAEALAFLRTHESLDGPDIELGFVPGPFVDGGYGTPTAHAMSLAINLLQPVSRGSIVLRDPEAAHPPRIDPGYFTEPGDLNVLVEGIRSAMDIFDAEALAVHAGDWMDSPAPDATRTAIEAFIRRNASTGFHPVGTCRLGSDNQTSVVDTSLRVHGITGLRIADASVFPHIGRGHPHATVVALAERAADLIRAQHP